MFNEKRIEEIRKNIQISTILSDHEKSDWLNLLDLMNDKQLGELEEILGAMPGQQPAKQGIPAPSAQDIPVAKMPPLSHIANVPADVTMTHSVPPAADVKPVPQPPVKVAIDKLSPKPSTLPLHQPMPAKPSPPPAPVKPMVAKPKPPTSGTLKKLVIGQVSDIQAFDVATLRQYELQSVVDAVRGAIQANGYFHILQQLEASPLYRSYIETGKIMLGHGKATVTDPETTLTQTELEFITDLLRHMRFNTW